MASSTPGVLDATPPRGRVRSLVAPEAAALVPGLIVVALLLVWAVHNGGYDEDTWYWGALLVLGMLAAVLVGGIGRLPLSGAAGIALAAFVGYVLWSYASIAWAGSPGDALTGSNRALLYLLLFALMASLPWSSRALMVALLTYTIGVGVIAFVILFRLASVDNITSLLVDGRLGSPTGYFNSTAALFTIDAALAIALAARRELPGPLRGFLIAIASAGLQLAVVGQSRGWLFTLPIVIVASLAIVRDRLAVVVAAVLPILAALIPVHRLVAVFGSDVGAPLRDAARRAGHAALLLCAATFVVGTLIAWAQTLLSPRPLSRRRRRQIGTVMVLGALVLGGAGVAAATHGHPFSFAKRQWVGFTKPPTQAPSGSHFATVGSGRYDFWRVSLHAALADPIGGLGQDNFTNYYLPRRHTDEEPMWNHSLEMRLLSMTGFVGFGLFVAFLVAGAWAAVKTRRLAADRVSAMAGVAMLPLVVWLAHGSVDWFWEVPALTGPALGFLGAAIAVRPRDGDEADAEPVARADGRAAQIGRRIPVWARVAAGVLALGAAVVVLGFPYLSVREVSTASDLRSRNPNAALKDLTTAADLNPLDPNPAVLAGTIALRSGNLTEADRRFHQAIDRDPGAWFSWFGDGLAASALGDSERARQDYERAHAINSRSDAVRTALAQVETNHPVSPAAGLGLLVLAT